MMRSNREKKLEQIDIGKWLEVFRTHAKCKQVFDIQIA